MFLDHYGLREQPFGVTPDPRFLYFSRVHREALASLQYGIECGRGFTGLIAEPGMGKTTLLFHLLEKLRKSAHTAFLFQTQCDSPGFLRCVLADLGVKAQSHDLVEMQRQLNDFLVRESRIGQPLVLVVDEAQNLDNSVLETIRMLSNFETPRAKLMHIILAGQPKLADKLASAKLVQLRQRLSIISRLPQLSLAETAGYISHRLQVAGYRGKPLFTRDALAGIRYSSQGIPRNISNLCFHALTIGFAKGQKTIDASILAEALTDTNVESLSSDSFMEDKPCCQPYLERTAWFAGTEGQAARRFLARSEELMATWRSKFWTMTQTTLSAGLSSCSRAVIAWQAAAGTGAHLSKDQAFPPVQPRQNSRFELPPKSMTSRKAERTNMA